MKPSKIAIVIPCLNEESILPLSTEQLLILLQELTKEQLIANDSFVLYVDDGSNDSTWEIISNYNQSEPRVQGLRLTSNTGQQNAILAGLHAVMPLVDAAITIDADMQDDISVIADMICRFREGKDIVYGVRRNRSTDTWMKRYTAHFYYNMMHILGTPIIANHSEFRLMSRHTLELLADYNEANLFLRGIIPTLGLPSATVSYDRKPRASGHTKYSYLNLTRLALSSITAFSIRPVRLVLAMGIICLFISLGFFAWSIYIKLTGQDVHGWTSLMVSIWFIGGSMLYGIGIIGEYIGNIYMEVKHRPRYHVAETTMTSL